MTCLYELFHCYFLYDPKTGSLTWKVSKGRALAGTAVGWITVKGYRETKLLQRCHKVHRVIFMMMTHRWPDLEIDHVNGNKLDNRWANLRECRHLENMHNQNKHRHNTSSVTGVCWHKRMRQWQAYIANEGKQIHLGAFDRFEEAVAARKSAEQSKWQGFRQVSDIVSST